MPKRFGLIADPARVTEIGRFYRAAGLLIQQELIKIDPENFKETKAQTVENNINRIIKKMDRRAARWTGQAIPEAYKNGMTISRNILNILGAKKDRMFDNKEHMRTVELDEEETIFFYLQANASIRISTSQYINVLRMANKNIMQIEAFGPGDFRDEEYIAGLLDETVKTGGSRQDLAALIRNKYKTDLLEAKFININGRNYEVGKYSKMVARTRMRVVQSDAVKNMSSQYENDLIEISDHGTESEICKEFEGNTYSISGATPGYEVLAVWPPFHPNCEHFASPTSEAAIAVAGR